MTSITCYEHFKRDNKYILFCFQIFELVAYLMKVIQVTRRLRFYPYLKSIYLTSPWCNSNLHDKSSVLVWLVSLVMNISREIINIFSNRLEYKKQTNMQAHLTTVHYKKIRQTKIWSKASVIPDDSECLISSTILMIILYFKVLPRI
jgi:hypothetical protein